MSDSIAAEAASILEQAQCMYSEEEVNRAVDNIADQITAELESTVPVVLSVMKGGLIYTGKLLERLRFPLELDYVHATRYKHALEGGSVEWIVTPQCSLSGRTVLIVDDILDVGSTLLAIIDACYQQGAKKVYTSVLVDKQHDRKAKKDWQADFTALRAEDRFLFGCGMDYKGLLRNAPGIYSVKGH